MKHGQRKKISKIIIAAFFVSIVAYIPATTYAAFNPSYIISDFEFFNYNSMSARGIQDFLSSQSGILKDASFNVDETQKTAAQIIHQYSQEYKVNPKVLLVTLQKEQSLITNPNPTQNALDCAMGYEWGNGCSWMFANKPDLKGFTNQVQSAAWQFRRYTDFAGSYAYQKGKTYTFTDLSGSKVTTVTITNQASANLYNYTPHVYNGNYNFNLYWNKWFQIKYPDGSLIRAEGEPGVWLINHGKRYGFYSSISFVTRGYSFKNVIVIPKAEVLAYEYGGHIDFPNLTFIDDGNGSLYFIDDLEKRPVSHAVKQVFMNEGLLYEQEIIVPTNSKQRAVLNSFDTGSPLPSPNTVAYPTGVLIQNISTGAIGYVKEGVMHMLHSKEVLRTQFPNKGWVRVSAAEFNAFPQGTAMKLRDGTLVRAPKYGGGVFIISNGQKRPITSRNVFDGLGFKMENVVVTNDRTIDLHPTGYPFDGFN